MGGICLSLLCEQMFCLCSHLCGGSGGAHSTQLKNAFQHFLKTVFETQTVHGLPTIWSGCRLSGVPHFPEPEYHMANETINMAHIIIIFFVTVLRTRHVKEFEQVSPLKTEYVLFC